MPDPSLTELGKQQCEELKKAFPYHDKLTHHIASPMRRTIYTELLSFQEPRDSTAHASQAKLLAIPELQEVSELPCDTGSEPEALAAEFSTGPWANAVDLSLVHKGWNLKGPTTPYYSTAAKLAERARNARRILRSIGLKHIAATGRDAHIVVVTHGGFLHYFTGDWEESDKLVGTGWANTEFRSYGFRVEGDSDEEAAFVETDESRSLRGNENKPLTFSEQTQLRAIAEAEWQRAGFQAKPAQKL